ncbi:MAG TPA: hypothetical protein VHW44_31590 [Pseudonocardiaceae bacterium]|nr:hypothetical protein [Pseudonocardiaceae bacterium]
MASVGEIVAGLDQALVEARAAVARLAQAEAGSRRSNVLLAGLLSGSRQAEAAAVSRLAAAVPEQVDQARAAIAAGVALIEA